MKSQWEYTKQSGIWDLTTAQLNIIFHYYNFCKRVKPDEDWTVKSHNKEQINRFFLRARPYVASQPLLYHDYFKEINSYSIAL